MSIKFASDEQAEHQTVTRLGPVLERAESAGVIESWFFIRKPWWRFRYLPASNTAVPARQLIEDTVRQMHDDRQLARWAVTIYEPETCAFGGQTGMTVAHGLFHHDSRHIIAYLGTSAQAPPGGGHTNPAGRRELSLLLCAALMKAAGLDRFEQADSWAKVASLRPPLHQPPAQRWRDFKTAAQRLITTDTSPVSVLRTSGPLSSASAWLTAFEYAGAALRKQADEGGLTRGLRAVIAHHVIFHWNRIGLPAPHPGKARASRQRSHFRRTPRPAADRSPNPAPLTGPPGACGVSRTGHTAALR